MIARLAFCHSHLWTFLSSPNYIFSLPPSPPWGWLWCWEQHHPRPVQHIYNLVCSQTNICQLTISTSCSSLRLFLWAALSLASPTVSTVRSSPTHTTTTTTTACPVMSQSVYVQSFPPPAHPVLALLQRSTRGPRTEPWGLPGAPQHRGGRSRGQLCVTINLFLVLLNFFLNFFSGSFFVSIFLYNYPFLKSFFYTFLYLAFFPLQVPFCYLKLHPISLRKGGNGNGDDVYRIL